MDQYIHTDILQSATWDTSFQMDFSQFISRLLGYRFMMDPVVLLRGIPAKKAIMTPGTLI